jgi:integrase
MGVFKRWRKYEDGSKAAFWYIRYALNGKIKWEAVGKAGVVTKDVALRRLAKRKQQIQLGQLDEIGVQIPILSEFTENYIEYQRDVKQKRSWKKDVAHLKRWNAVFGSRKLSEISAKDIDDYKLKRLAEVKPASVNRELEVLSHLFTIAERWKKFFGKNPVSQAGLFKLNNQVERILTPEEEERLLSYSAPHLKPIINVALNTGMRKGEILTLTWEDVDFDNNILTVKHTISKSKKPKVIPISSKVRKLLLEQKLKSGGSNFVFTFEGKPIKDVRRAFERACKRASIYGFRFHDLRHTAATRMIEAGVSIVAVSKVLGHAEIRTTMRYAHPEDSLRDAVEKLGNFTQNRSQNRSQQVSEYDL